MMHYIARRVAMSAAVISLAVSTPVLAHSLPHHHWPEEKVTAVTPTTLTVQDDGHSQAIPLASARIRAGMYPAPAKVLRPGETVTVLGSRTEAPLVVIHPAAYGTLTKPDRTWKLDSARHGAYTLTGNPPLLLGMRELSPGTKAAVFGPVTGKEVDVTAVASRPVMARAKITATGGNTIKAQSEQYGTLSYKLEALPHHLTQRLSQLKPGDSVVACLNPLDHQVLMIMPDHLDHWVKTLEHGTAGQVVAVSNKDITLTNPLGTVTVPINRQTVVQWPGHPKAKVDQIPPGARIMALRHPDASLKISVLHTK